MGEIFGGIFLLVLLLTLVIAAVLIVAGWVVDTDWPHQFRSIPFRLSARWEGVKSTIEVSLVVFVIGLIIHVPLRIWSGNELSVSAFIATIAALAASLAFIFIVFCLGHVFMGLFQTDVSALGLNVVLAQGVYNDERFATEVQVDAALRDQSEYNRPEPEFDD